MPEVEAESFPPILTTAMAADLLHVHVEYLRRMVREGRIPAHRFPGGREIRYLRDELIEWVRQQPGENRAPSAAERCSPLARALLTQRASTPTRPSSA